jgi:cyclomaltodextrin glucanotransferase
MSKLPVLQRTLSSLGALSLLCACAHAPEPTVAPVKAVQASSPASIYGTLEPLASDAVYFVMTDRFVNGDTGNDQRTQGGKNRSFDRPTPNAPAGKSDNVGYLGGDFKGLLDHADYIAGMGFGAVWITPIVDNPDEAFTGGTPATWNGFWTDGGKTGYHGYWGVNFYKLDEHLPSPGLDFRALSSGMRAKGLKTVLDIVANHGSPSYTMPRDQPKFGELYDAQGKLIADHQNLDPLKLDPKNNPLHAMYAAKPAELAELSDMDEDNPAVQAYFQGAYLQWIEQGAHAFRIDTIRHMKHAFWRDFAAGIRAKHPNFFMFAESFDYQAEAIASHTLPENGAISVLDFPMKAAMEKAFVQADGGYRDLLSALYLRDSPYHNAYELMTFYDNHDMPRFAGDDAAFINAHNWLFTARGIPVIYYGSEVGFMRGTAEHGGNRNYFGADAIAQAPQHAIYQQLQNIAMLRKQLPALQRGVQLNLRMDKDQAAFLRVYQHAGLTQTALVLLNKASAPAAFEADARLPAGAWVDAISKQNIGLDALSVPANGVRVLLYDQPISGELLAALQSQIQQANALPIEMLAVSADKAPTPIGYVFAHDSPYGLVLRPSLKGLSPGLHGFHVHQNASCEAAEKDGQRLAALAAGPHFDPHNSGLHGEPWGDGHLGDLPALFVDAQGNARQPVLAPRLKRADLSGRSLMLHAGGDNHADHPEPLGGGGARIACGVIAASAAVAKTN